MKKVFAFMMALALMLSLSVTSFAEGEELPGKITVKNATIDKDYAVYKIFDATYSDDSVAYSIKTDNQFFTALFGTDGTGFDYFDYNATTGAVTRKLDADGNPLKNDAQLFNYLTDLVKGKTATQGPKKASSETVVFENLDYGYYVITSTLGGTATINSAKPQVEVKDKNATTIQPTKTVDKVTAQVGDTVNFVVEYTALNYDGENKITEYTVKDTLDPDNWAKIDSTSIHVFVNDTEISNWTKVSSNDYSFELNIPWVDNTPDKGLLYEPSSVVKVIYSATVLEGATEEEGAAVNKNTAKVEWNGKEGTAETTTKVYNLGFTKVDENGAPLAGAKFGLYSDEGCTNPVNVTDKGNGVYMVGGSSNEVVTLESGEIVIMGLNAGTYYLKELEAPAGYNKLATAKAIVVGEPNAGGTNVSNLTVGETTYTANNAPEKVVNNKGVELPSTGGEGTMKMITIGSIVALAFAILLITNKKMTAYQD